MHPTLTPAVGVEPSNRAASGRRLRAIVAVFLTLGTLFLLINLSLPLVRNSFVYANAALNIIEHGFNPIPVVADTRLSHGKPALFSLLAAPLIALFDLNVGIKLASWLGTAFFIWMVVLVMRRLNGRLGPGSDLTPMAFTLAVFNPLVLYQFWSGYPDALFAGEVLLAFLLCDVIAAEPERDTRYHILGLGVVIYLAVLTKLFGAVLGLACPLYLLLHGRALLEQSTRRRSKMTMLAAVFAGLALALILAKLKLNPTLDFAAEEIQGGGFGIYMEGISRLSVRALLAPTSLIVISLALNFHVSLLLLATKGALRAWRLAPAAFAVIYLLGLLPYKDTVLNMRFVLPVLPFLAVILAAGARSIQPRARRALLSVYAGLASILVLNYNVVPVNRALSPLTGRVMAVSPRVGVWLDSLRLEQHLSLARAIDRINQEVPPQGVLYWCADYYGTATQVGAERLGIRTDIDVRYVSSLSEVPYAESPAYVTQYPPMDWLWQPPAWSKPTPVGDGLFRLDPLRH